ncbi:MAG: hypothetical protein CVV06_03680 [Gammaproteobacteria bacterium HGW-Gammaproteobacteria-10]|nr:MAG: hypothetical protein CVV06_03680 [Gammaproteobacteria bacterium HGW-Gammaproteobacteria-10]
MAAVENIAIPFIVSVMQNMSFVLKGKQHLMSSLILLAVMLVVGLIRPSYKNQKAEARVKVVSFLCVFGTIKKSKSLPA